MFVLKVRSHWSLGCGLLDLVVLVGLARNGGGYSVSSSIPVVSFGVSTALQRGAKQVLKMPRNTSQGSLSHTQRGEKAPRSTNRWSCSGRRRC